jgi:hypothetical protein
MNRMRRTSKRALAARPWPAAAVALLAVLALAPAAGAQQLSWLSPIGLENSGGTQAAQAVACATASQCTSVDANGQQVTFNPATGASTGSSSVDLRGTVSSLACPSSTQCTAVDNLGNQVTFDPAAGTLIDGGLQSVGSANPLTSVACSTTAFCVTVDDQGGATSFDPLTGAAAGRQIVDPPTPPTPPSKTPIPTPLSSVACSSDATACVAVDNLGNEITINYATPASAIHSVDTHPLSSVSCRPDLTSCVAVDDHGQEITFNPADGSVSGTHVIDSAAGPPPVGIALTSVSCASDYSQCTAVDGQGNEVTFNATNGSVISSASVDAINRLDGVSCAPGTDTECAAIDTHGNEASFDPTTGSSIGGGVHSVAPNALASLACPVANQCTAVEAGGREITFDPTAGHVTGQDGHNNIGPSIIDATGNRLTSVSCSSATQCTAVDTGAFEETFNPVTGRLNAPGGFNKMENGQSLESVSCPTAVQCTAVDASGNQVTFNPQQAAPNSVNNASPNQVDGTPDRLLVSVVCLTAHSCVAVDHGGAEVSFDPTSIDAGTPTEIEIDHHPSALSCASAAQCTAVDDAGQATTFDPTSVASSQTNIAGPTSVDAAGALNGVSCPSTTACVAVDGHGNSVQFAPASLGGAVVERVPEAAALQAVNCPTAYECAAVDTGGNAFAGFLAPANTAVPTITGTAQQGQTLTEHNGSWANGQVTHYAYQWQDCDDSGCSAIPGATGSTYTLQPSDVGESIAVQETATNIGGDSQPANSAHTSVVLPLAPASQGPPAIAGTVGQGQVLSEYHGQWSGNPSSYAIQWESCNGFGTGCVAIPGATGQSYVPTAFDIGRKLMVQETTSNAGGTSPSAASSQTAPVAPARQADIRTLTYRETAVSWQSALLHGVVYTQGAPAVWSFQYGKTTLLGSSTPGQAVAPGNTSEIPAAALMSRLKPNTTYYARVVETVPADAYRAGVQSLGNIVRFTTPLVGSLHLKSARVPVKGSHGLVGLDCRAPVGCAARLSVTASHSIGSGRHRHQQILRCAVTSTSVSAGGSRQVGLSVSQACLSLIGSSRTRVLAATLVASSTSGQHGFTQNIQLRG